MDADDGEDDISGDTIPLDCEPMQPIRLVTDYRARIGAALERIAAALEKTNTFQNDVYGANENARKLTRKKDTLQLHLLELLSDIVIAHWAAESKRGDSRK